MLRYSQMMDMLNYTKKLSDEYNFSYSTSITTNGSLINKNVVKELLLHNCQSLQITIDGGKKSHDITRVFKNGEPSYDLIMKNINEELEELIICDKSRFYLRFNLHNNSLDEVKTTLMEIKENLRKYITVIIRAVYSTELYDSNNSNSVNNLQSFYDVAAGLGFQISHNKYYNCSCEACGDENIFYITPDLSIWKCINNMSLLNGRIGNLSNEGELMIDAEKIADWYAAADCFSDEKCRNCKRLPDCFGGCILFKSMNGKRKCTPFDLMALPYFYI